MKFWLGGLTAALLAMPAVACATTNTAPQVGRLTSGAVSHALLLPGEKVTVAGRATPTGRPVELQRRDRGRWVGVGMERATSAGRYSFTVRATTTATRYRAVATATHEGTRTYQARAGRSIVVRAHRARGQISFVGAAIGQTTRGATGRYPVIATFRPVRRGARVLVQRYNAHDRWTTVARGREDRSGRFAAQLSMSRTRTQFYRAVAKPGHGAKRIATNPQNATFRPLAWSDEFGGSTLNRARWTLRSVAGTGRDCAVSSLSRVHVGGGAATLSVARQMRKNAFGQTVPVTKRGCPYGYYDNAALQSVPAFQHGVFAARIRFESGAGQHGAFVAQAGGPRSTEMDTVEYFGDNRRDFGIGRGVYASPTSTRSGKHVGGVYPQARKLLGGRTPSNSWHVYAVRWTPHGYLFTIDGKPTLQTSKPYVASTPEYLVIGLVTSDYELPRLARDSHGQVVASKSQMKVDWVRAWQ